MTDERSPREKAELEKLREYSKEADKDMAYLRATLSPDEVEARLRSAGGEVMANSYQDLEEQLRATPLAKPFLVTTQECANALADLRRQLEEARRERDEIKELYEAGCAQWSPVYKLVLDRAETAERERDEAQRAGERAGEEIVGLTTALRLAELKGGE